jgi:O-antigen ligase
MLALAPFVYFMDNSPSRFPIGPWIPWLCVLFLSTVWAESFNRYTFQDVFQIATPFVIAPIASKAMKTKKEIGTFIKANFHCLLLLLTALFLNRIAGVEIRTRAMSMTAAVIGCLFVAQVRERRLTAIAGWGGCLLVAGLTGSRMATFALLVEWLIIPRYRRQTSRVVIAALVAVLAVFLFFTPVFQERFFRDDTGTLEDVAKGEFSTTGRFDLWPELLEQIQRRPLLGWGPHGSAVFVGQVWHGMSKPHNDYLRILLEQGFVGLSVFLFGVVVQMLSLWRRGFSNGNEAAVFRSAAFTGLVVMLLMAITDNPISYGVWFMHPLFVYVGASYPSTPGKQLLTDQF